jgi:hypothetical protein
MASKAENQVITPVAFPAASSIFTNPTEYDLRNNQYGAIFLPQVLTATTSLIGRLGSR